MDVTGEALKLLGKNCSFSHGREAKLSACDAASSIERIRELASTFETRIGDMPRRSWPQLAPNVHAFSRASANITFTRLASSHRISFALSFAGPSLLADGGQASVARVWGGARRQAPSPGPASTWTWRAPPPCAGGARGARTYQL